MQLHAIRHGADHPVRFLLVHGLASCARLWDGVGEALAARGHGSIAVDLRGHGESPKPDDDYDFATITDDLSPYLDSRPVVVGQSYGADVAVELAARRPSATLAIACVDGGAGNLSDRFSSLEEALVALRPPYELFEGVTMAEHEKRFRRRHPDWPEISVRGALAAFDVDQAGGVRSRLTWARHAQILTAMWDSPPSARWPEIGVPVLFLVASERLRRGVERALTSLHDAEAVWFEGADHDVHAQKPDAVADALAHLLDRVSAQPDQASRAAPSPSAERSAASSPRTSSDADSFPPSGPRT